MKKLIILTALFVTSLAHAGESYTAKDIKDRLEIRADVYALDESGTKLIEGPKRSNYWKSNKEGRIHGDWSSNFGKDESIMLRMEFVVNDDSTISVTLSEFGTMTEKPGGHPEFSNVLQEKKLVLKDFEPITLVSKGIKNKHVVVRYIPALREVSEPISLDSLPVAGKGIRISDNKGYLWAEGMDLNGKYIGVTSHRGTLVVSYVPFKGAHEMGSVDGNVMNLNIGSDYKIKMTSESSFLPAGVTAKVYAIYLPDRKSSGFNSVHSFDTGKEDRALENIK
jgi:hypothetical protein